MTKLVMTLSLALCFLAPSPLLAQLELGGQLSYADDTDLGVGGRVSLGLPSELGLRLLGSFDYFFPDGDFDYWEVNGNVAYPLPLEAQAVSLYVGGGLNIAHAFNGASDTRIGLNLLGGVDYLVQTLRLYGELRLEVEGGEQFVLTGGVLFPVGPGL